jgi:hypothetical protein
LLSTPALLNTPFCVLPHQSLPTGLFHRSLSPLPPSHYKGKEEATGGRRLRATEYALVSSGTCQSNNRDRVQQKADCEAAAEALGLSDTSAELVPDLEYPSGCYLWGYASGLYFNAAESSTSCGSYSIMCLCGMQAYGASLHKFQLYCTVVQQ